MSATPSPATNSSDVLPPVDRQPNATVVTLHAEDAAHLRLVRTRLVRAPHVGLEQLLRHDERLAAHLDGLAIAGSAADPALRELLAQANASNVFVVAVRAIEMRDAGLLNDVLGIAKTVAEARRGVLSAFGWVSPSNLRGITKSLLESDDAAWRDIGLSACAMHRVDPGAALVSALSLGAHAADAESAALRSGATRVAGALGRVDLRDACATLASEPSDDSAATADAALAAVVLGDRGRGLDALRRLAATDGPSRDTALACLLKISAPDESSALLKSLHADPAALRTLIRAIGIAGEPHYVPWLISRMGSAVDARIAGEAFSLMTGVDLDGQKLDRPQPEDVEPGPNDNPGDGDVAMDEDDGLPWPAPAKVAAWWQQHGGRFTPGVRHFVGQPPSRSHCANVLESGFQRQRRHAAEYLALLDAGAPLFNVAAPAWRQKRMLAQMGLGTGTS